MNQSGMVNPNDPVEHVFFQQVKPGSYKYKVKYSRKKTHKDKIGGRESLFLVSVCDVDGNLLEINEGTISINSFSQEFEFTF